MDVANVLATITIGDAFVTQTVPRNAVLLLFPTYQKISIFFFVVMPHTLWIKIVCEHHPNHVHILKIENKKKEKEIRKMSNGYFTWYDYSTTMIINIIMIIQKSEFTSKRRK